MDYLVLNNLQFHAFHGVYEQEQKIGNTFLVDLKISADFSKACQSDQLEDAINYASVFEVVKEVMKTPCKLIEHVAENIGKEVKTQFPQVQSIEIKVTKINPPIVGQLDSVSIILQR